MEQIGAAALGIPEEHGGAGFSLFESLIVLQEVGRSLAPSPLLATLVATEALLAGGDDDARARLLPRIAAGEIATVALDPTAPVLDGDRAAIVLAVVDGDLVEVEEPGAAWAESMDQTTRLARLRSTAGTTIGDGRAALARAEVVGAAATTALQVGLADRALAMTVAYSRERVQFGRPIGSFQALQHRMADLHVLLEMSRSAAWAAWHAVSTGGDDAVRAHPRGQGLLLRRPRHDRRRDHPAARRHRHHLGARRPARLQARPRPRSAVRPGSRAPGRPRPLSRVAQPIGSGKRPDRAMVLDSRGADAGWMRTFSFPQTAGLVAGAALAVLLLPTTVEAAGASLVRITDGAGPVAKVDPNGRLLVGDGRGPVTVDGSVAARPTRPTAPWMNVNGTTLNAATSSRILYEGVAKTRLNLTTFSVSVPAGNPGSVTVSALVLVGGPTSNCNNTGGGGFGAAERFTIVVPVGGTVVETFPTPLSWTQYGQGEDKFCVQVSGSGPSGWSAHILANGFVG